METQHFFAAGVREHVAHAHERGGAGLLCDNAVVSEVARRLEGCDGEACGRVGMGVGVGVGVGVGGRMTWWAWV